MGRKGADWTPSNILEADTRGLGMGLMEPQHSLSKLYYCLIAKQQGSKNGQVIQHPWETFQMGRKNLFVIFFLKKEDIPHLQRPDDLWIRYLLPFRKH